MFCSIRASVCAPCRLAAVILPWRGDGRVVVERRVFFPVERWAGLAVCSPYCKPFVSCLVCSLCTGDGSADGIPVGGHEQRALHGATSGTTSQFPRRQGKAIAHRSRCTKYFRRQNPQRKFLSEETGGQGGWGVGGGILSTSSRGLRYTIPCAENNRREKPLWNLRKGECTSGIGQDNPECSSHKAEERAHPDSMPDTVTLKLGPNTRSQMMDALAGL